METRYDYDDNGYVTGISVKASDEGDGEWLTTVLEYEHVEVDDFDTPAFWPDGGAHLPAVRQDLFCFAVR